MAGPQISPIADQTVTVDKEATFQAAITDSAQNLWFSWASIPEGVVFSQPTYQWSPQNPFKSPQTIQTTAKAPVGTYKIQLTANSGQATTATATLTVTDAVVPTPPSTPSPGSIASVVDFTSMIAPEGDTVFQGNVVSKPEGASDPEMAYKLEMKFKERGVYKIQLITQQTTKDYTITVE